MVKLSDRQRRIAKMKVKGVKNKDIAKIEYPQASPDSQAVIVSRELKKPQVAKYIEQGKELAIKELGITWLEVLRPRVEALYAVKSNEYTGEILPDHLVRLRASESLEKVISKNTTFTDSPEIKAALEQGIDEIQLVRLLKN